MILRQAELVKAYTCAMNVIAVIKQPLEFTGDYEIHKLRNENLKISRNSKILVTCQMTFPVFTMFDYTRFMIK